MGVYLTLEMRFVLLISNVHASFFFLSFQQWTSGLGFEEKEGWRAWYVDDQVRACMCIFVCTEQNSSFSSV